MSLKLEITVALLLTFSVAAIGIIREQNAQIRDLHAQLDAYGQTIEDDTQHLVRFNGTKPLSLPP